MLGRLFSKPTEERHGAPFVVHASNGWWGWTQGSNVDALHNAAVWACVDVLASSVAELPVDSVRDVDGARLPVRPTPALLSNPSATVTLDVWLYQLMWSILYDGNGFGLVKSVDRTGWPTLIELIDPSIVTERRVEDGFKQAKVDGKVERVYPAGDLWHVPGKMVVPGNPFGLSPVEYAGAAINAGLSAEEFGRQFFADGAHPSAIIYSDDPNLTEPQARAIKERFKEATSGTRAPAVFGSGLKYEQVSVNPSDSHFIDLQRFTVEQVCRFFRVPPSMVYGGISGQAVTYANVSQADLHYLKHSLDGYLVRIERALSAILPRPQLVKFNRSALLRTDAPTRHSVYAQRLASKTMTVNEVRALEDEPPFDGDEFDDPGVPAAPAAEAAPEPEPEGEPEAPPAMPEEGAEWTR